MLGELSALVETLRRLQCGLAAEPEEIAVGIAAALHLVEAALAVWMCGQYVLFFGHDHDRVGILLVSLGSEPMQGVRRHQHIVGRRDDQGKTGNPASLDPAVDDAIGSASCRESVCQSG